MPDCWVMGEARRRHRKWSRSRAQPLGDGGGATLPQRVEEHRLTGEAGSRPLGDWGTREARPSGEGGGVTWMAAAAARLVGVGIAILG